MPAPDSRRILPALTGIILIALSWSALPAGAADRAGPAWPEAVARYLETLARPDGGYAWPDQSDAELTPTFAALGCYRALGVEVPAEQRGRLAAFVRGAHPQRGRRPEYDLRGFVYEQVQALRWMGDDARDFERVVRGWNRPIEYLARYERGGNPVFQQELAALTCRELLGMPAADLPPAYVRYLDERRRPDGSFNNTPAADGSRGHVINTLWGLRALRLLGRDGERRAETVDWLRSCQTPAGGFFYEPDPQVGRVEDVVYTWAAVLALKQLGAEPADRAGCIRFLHSLYNADGGFGDRPGWPSNPLATFYAVEALAALDALGAAPPTPNPPPAPPPVPADLKVFTIQIQAPGQGSPADAVELARSLRIHLWGAKNAKPEWLARAQAAADERKVPVRFFVADEEYGTFMTLPGLGTYSHISDIVAPAGVDDGPNLAGRQAWTWAQFRDRRIVPLERAKGRLVWQFGENEPLARALLDESVERGSGYAAVSTFHFGNPDFIRSQPFLYHYQHRLPLVALQDAHAQEPWWWADQLTGFRTLFLAREATWDQFLEAMKHNRVVSVRRDAVTENKLRMHGGAPGVQAFVREREGLWRWWPAEDEAALRPAVSVAVLTPADVFEAGRPDKGAAVRVRCRWDNTAQGKPKRQVVELTGLSIDGKPVTTRLVEVPNPARGANQPPLADVYHLSELPDLPPGRHTVTAAFRTAGEQDESTQTVESVVP